MSTERSAAIESLQRHEEKLAHEIGGIVNDASDMLKNFTTTKLDSARASIAHAQTAVADTAKQYASSTDQYVHANPWKSVGVAAAGGLLIGILLARR